jgi:hypothetical protein
MRLAVHHNARWRLALNLHGLGPASPRSSTSDLQQLLQCWPLCCSSCVFCYGFFFLLLMPWYLLSPVNVCVRVDRWQGLGPGRHEALRSNAAHAQRTGAAPAAPAAASGAATAATTTAVAGAC